MGDLVIWKFRLPHAVTTLALPQDAAVLTVQTQGEALMLWALCSKDAPTEPRRFAIYGTGNALPPEPGRYLATVQDVDLVWHVFELAKSAVAQPPQPPVSAAGRG